MEIANKEFKTTKQLQDYLDKTYGKKIPLTFKRLLDDANLCMLLPKHYLPSFTDNFVYLNEVYKDMSDAGIVHAQYIFLDENGKNITPDDTDMMQIRSLEKGFLLRYSTKTPKIPQTLELDYIFNLSRLFVNFREYVDFGERRINVMIDNIVVTDYPNLSIDPTVMDFTNEAVRKKYFAYR